MTSEELRKQFLDFFKQRGHIIIPSSSLLPSDKTVLFTTAGMQQFSLYLSGKKDVVKDFKARHLASSQKCFRTDDIEEVGDDTHHTFFEMLGNWSIGQDEDGYFKEGAIKYALEFLDLLGLDKDRLHITVFKGEGSVSKDEEAINLWINNGIPKERIREYGKKDNFWGPVGDTGPCGPCSELHYDRGEEYGCGGANCGPNCDDCKRFVEIWNLVFMQYNKNEKGEYELLSQTNIDTGIGFERLISLLQEKNSSYETDLFKDVIKKIEEVSDKKYLEYKKEFRVIADHARSIVFLLSEGIIPSNVSQGYILRRLIRRSIRYCKLINFDFNSFYSLMDLIVKKYKDIYPEVLSTDYDVVRKEEEKFNKTIETGLQRIEKLLLSKENRTITGEESFDLYQTYGFPIELIEEIANERDFIVDKKGFEEALKKHQEISREGSEKKFGGVASDSGEMGVKYHTVTHLLHAALRKILGEHVKQMGSDINTERLRFDFAHNTKMTSEEIKKVEDLVNEKIKEGLNVQKQEMPLDEAIKSGAIAFFKEKYGDMVFVWTIYNPETKEVFSKEVCGGPHVDNLKDLGMFEIIKEESSSAGVRRIKAILK
ncbi:MAG: alanine--tRNA ligase [Candidatus Pacebacteria bacterium]|nr:alanine--tRNA ligase [Candidatus Paceibacterota bacterium]MDD5752635.1 alanine--tRNA ligase [Candidatus Paceibacterota bacterium]